MRCLLFALVLVSFFTQSSNTSGSEFNFQLLDEFEQPQEQPENSESLFDFPISKALQMRRAGDANKTQKLRIAIPMLGRPPVLDRMPYVRSSEPICMWFRSPEPAIKTWGWRLVG